MISSVLTAVVSLLAIGPWSSVVTLAASIAVVVMVFTGGANDWFAGSPPRRHSRAVLSPRAGAGDGPGQRVRSAAPRRARPSVTTCRWSCRRPTARGAARPRGRRRSPGGHRDDPGPLGQRQAELEAVAPAEVGGVGEGEVGALRHPRVEPEPAQTRAQQVAALLEIGGQATREVGLVVEGVGHGGLQRRSRGEGQPLLGGQHGADQVGRPGGPADLPPGERPRLARAESVRVRSAMPGSVASGTCSWSSKTRCS